MYSLHWSNMACWKIQWSFVKGFLSRLSLIAVGDYRNYMQLESQALSHYETGIICSNLLVVKFCKI